MSTRLEETSHSKTQKEALRLAFEEGAARKLTFQEWWEHIEDQLNRGQLLTIQPLGPIYRVMQDAYGMDVDPGSELTKEAAGAE